MAKASASRGSDGILPNPGLQASTSRSKRSDVIGDTCSPCRAITQEQGREGKATGNQQGEGFSNARRSSGLGCSRAAAIFCGQAGDGSGESFPGQGKTRQDNVNATGTQVHRRPMVNHIKLDAKGKQPKKPGVDVPKRSMTR